MKASFGLSIKVISVLTAMTVFSGCPDKGGGGAQPAVTIAGVNSNGECSPEAANAYTFIRNSGYGTDVQQIRNACTNLTNLIGGQACRIANQYPNQYQNQYPNQNQFQNQNAMISFADVQYKCNAATVGNGNNQGYPQPGYPGQTQPIQNVPTKNVVCSIDLTSGSAAGTISNMPVQVFANGGEYRLYANMQNTKSYLGGFINYTKYFSSEKLALLKLRFKAGGVNVADTLTLSADLRNGKSATATGFAGSEVRIEIAALDESDTSVIVSCAGQDQFNAGNQMGGDKIRCSVKENNNGKLTNANFINNLSDLIDLGIKPSKSSDLVLEGNGQNVMMTSVSPTVADETYKVVTSLVSPSSVKIKASGYSLDSNCSVQ